MWCTPGQPSRSLRDKGSGSKDNRSETLCHLCLNAVGQAQKRRLHYHYCFVCTTSSSIEFLKADGNVLVELPKERSRWDTSCLYCTMAHSHLPSRLYAYPLYCSQVAGISGYHGRGVFNLQSQAAKICCNLCTHLLNYCPSTRVTVGCLESMIIKQHGDNMRYNGLSG